MPHRLVLHSTFKHQEHQKKKKKKKKKKKYIENLKLFLTSINFTFSVICFFETWLDYLTLSGNASYELPNYTSKHQVGSDREGGGIYIHNPLNFKVRPDLSISNNDINSLS